MGFSWKIMGLYGSMNRKPWENVGDNRKPWFFHVFPHEIMGVPIEESSEQNQSNDVWIMDVLNSHGEYEGS